MPAVLNKFLVSARWIVATLVVLQFSVATAQELMNAREYELKADFAIKHGDVYTALELYQEAVAKNPEDYHLLFRLGELHMQTRDYASAQLAFKKIFEKKNAQYPLAKFYYGVMSKRLGEYSNSLLLLQEFAKGYSGPDNYIYKKNAKREAEGAKLALDLIDQKSTYTVTHPGASLNSAYTDFSPVFVSPSEMVYAALKADSVIGRDLSKSIKKFPYRARFYTAEKEGDIWTTKGELEGPFDTPGEETGNGTYTADGKRFYFTRCKSNEEHKMICQIYKSEKKKDSWSAPQKLDESINVPGFTATQPFAVSQGKSEADVLYYVSDRPQGKGGLDIWSSEYDTKRNKWQTPKNIGTRVNTDADEMTPFYDAQFDYLYFTSDGWPSVGGLDIFKVKGDDGKFRSYPENLGFPVNSGADDMYYSIDYKTNKGFIVSNRVGSISLKSPTCCDDIFELTLDRSLVFGLDGFTYYKLEIDTTDYKRILQGATVRLFRAESNTPVGETESDPNGFFFFPLNPESDYYITVGKEGFLSFKSDMITTKGLYMSDTLHQPAIVLMPVPKKPVKIDNVYYEFDSDVLTEDSKVAIDTTIYKIMIANPQVVLEIGSHTDIKGTHEYNVQLSSKRAQSVVRYLIAKGISKDRLQAKGYAETEPVAPNFHLDGSDNPEGRAKNRRTEFMIVGTIKLEDDLSGFPD